MRRRLAIPFSVLTAASLTTGVLLATVHPDPTPTDLVLDAASDAQQSGFAEQYDVLRDGHITGAEYRESLTRLTSCLSRNGLAYTTPRLSPVDNLRYLFEVRPGADTQRSSSLIDDCATRYWTGVSTLYASIGTQVMDEPLRVAALGCLTSAGYNVSGTEPNFPAMVGDPEKDGGAQREAATTCVFDSARRLYPDLPTVTVAA